MTANVEIITGEHPGVAVVPNEALRFQPRGRAEALIRDTTETGAAQDCVGHWRQDRPHARQTEERPWP